MSTIAAAGVRNKLAAYGQLMKFRLSMLVAFSSVFGFILASHSVDISSLVLLGVGGMLLSGGATTVNQIKEKSYDALMKRTENRPLPLSVVSDMEAVMLAFFSTLAGFMLIAQFNLFAAVLSIVSSILYCFVYTPLKRVGPVAVFVGAVPGALPPLIGWVAATGTITVEALIIFGIQFIWQFPHFWAIAWVSDEDYKKAGFKLLPFGGKKDLNTAIQIMTYTMLLIPLGLLPAKMGITGINSAVVATLCGVLFFGQTFRLMKDGSRKSALRIMFGSFIYLPVVQIAFLLDKV